MRRALGAAVALGLAAPCACVLPLTFLTSLCCILSDHDHDRLFLRAGSDLLPASPGRAPRTSAPVLSHTESEQMWPGETKTSNNDELEHEIVRRLGKKCVDRYPGLMPVLLQHADDVGDLSLVDDEALEPHVPKKWARARILRDLHKVDEGRDDR